MRGWRRDEWLFRGWPDDMSWWRVAMTPPEVRQILYINWDWWLTVTGGTRRPEDARVDAAWHEPIARAAATNAELIVVRRREGSRIVCVEGHVRLTGYALFPHTCRASSSSTLASRPRSPGGATTELRLRRRR
jgi:hypothetical protein